jgi:IS30 family transposase
MTGQYVSETLKQELWERWKRGESYSTIGRALGKPIATIYRIIQQRGGFAPQARVRGSRTLGLSEREEISRGVCAEASIRQIARTIGCSASSVSREIARNGGRTQYRACVADIRAWERARRPRRCWLACHEPLRRLVVEKLQSQWSPEQISRWLAKRFGEDDRMRVSHETIYRTLFIQSRGALKKELQKQLRSQRRLRRTKAYSARLRPHGHTADAPCIHERPAQAEDRAIPGHWEGDLLSGSNNSHIATLVERHSRFVMLVKVAGKDTHSVVSALSRHVRKLPMQLRRSLTWDRGVEMADHSRFTLATQVKVYFCDPHSPWQRGSNENTNGLLRQYFPKGSTDFRTYTQDDLDAVARELNGRPRQTLGWANPAETLNKFLVATTS